MEYEFTLKFKLLTADSEPDALVGRLAESGCDDALIGIGAPGRIALDFTRDAPSARDAIVSAIRDVKSAIPDAQLIEAGPDLVGLTDVAELVGVTRQNLRKLMVGNSLSFPAAVHEGSASIWHLAHLLRWFQARGLYEDPVKSLIDVSSVTMEVNVAKEAKRLPLPKGDFGELDRLVV